MKEKDQVEINGDIRDREVRVIGADGSQLGIMSAREALNIADEEGLDLVKVSPGATPPVCRIMDYGKYKYEQLKKQKEAKKNQKIMEIKEIWLSMTIDIGDLTIKARQCQKFLNSGNKVKVSIRMRGRQNAHSSLGVDVMNKFLTLLEAQTYVVEKQPLFEGRYILMIVAPAKKIIILGGA